LSDKISIKDFQAFSQEILDHINKSMPRVDFLRKILKTLLEFSGCDTVEIFLKDNDKFMNYRIFQKDKNSFQYNSINLNFDKETRRMSQKNNVIGRLCINIMKRRFDKGLSVFSTNGSFWTNNMDETFNSILSSEKDYKNTSWNTNTECVSLALIPLFFVDNVIGVIQLMSQQADYFTEDEIEQYESASPNIGIALVNHNAQSALRERVKELTCLYSIAKLAEQQELSLTAILEGIVKLLPLAWQYPESTSGSIELDGRVFSTSEFKQNGQKQTADIIINGKWRGVVEIAYLDIKPELDEGPFLSEERNLIDAIARQIALIVEKKEAEENKLKLQEQIRHADRLATIGQLGAGIAHELNEPLGNILGFAQLIKKWPELPNTVDTDLDKIVNATLNAREVIKKLLLFARQMPHKKDKINLNKMINDGLYLFEARCANEGIELDRILSAKLPEIIGDQAQISQVLVNLVVNAMQAMPDGGKLILKTDADNEHVSLVVEDTGIGMSKDVINKIFDPFFTTKDINEGTGLGLAVVHGIVTSHQGRIKVSSIIEKGTQFVIKLPIQ
jgi:two-component system NtrC family sensor kinase